MNSGQDARYFQNVFTFFKILLITPWYNFEKRTFDRPYLCKIYGCFLMLLKVASLAFMATDEALSALSEELSSGQKVASVFAYGCLGLLTLTTVFKSSFVDTKTWKTLLRNCHYIDTKTESRNSHLCCRFIGKQVFFLVFASYKAYAWMVLTKLSALHVLVISLTPDLYYEFSLGILLLMIVDKIKNGYFCLNTRLAKCSHSPNFVPEMRSLTQEYRLLGETIEAYDRIFGWQTLLVIFHCGIQLVYCLNFIIFCFTKDIYTIFVYQVLIISAVVLLLFILCGLLLLLMSIDSANRESRKFLDLCYKIQDHFKIESKEVEAITKLTNYSQRFSRDFSAAGFFKIDKTIICGLVGNVATYLIITMQLNESQRVHQ